MTAPTSPIKAFRVRNISVALFFASGGKFIIGNVSKTYKDAEGNYVESNGWTSNDLYALSNLARMAADYIVEKES